MSYKGYTIRDQISFLANPNAVRIPAFQVINRLSEHTPGEQLLGAAVAVVAMAEAVGIPPHELLTRASICLRQADGAFNTHIKAIRDYAANEILRRDENG